MVQQIVCYSLAQRFIILEDIRQKMYLTHIKLDFIQE
jgi:hypothetical protein